MFNKDVTHARMKRRIENPRVILLDCPLEFKKGESQTDVEITGETDFSKVCDVFTFIFLEYLAHSTIKKHPIYHQSQ